MKWRSFSWLLPALFLFIDKPIAEWLSGWHSLWLATYAKIATFCINPAWICSSFIMITLIMIAFDLKYQYKWIRSCASLGFGLLLIRVIKMCVGRSRPKLWLKQHIYTCKFFTFDSYYLSFPSSHSYAVFALAFIVSKHFPKWRVPIFVISALLSSSRVILHQHFASDIAGSCLIAYIIYLMVWKTKIGQALEGLPDRIIQKKA
ncbi:MAG: phosphatase PAP2 family protein [Chlamydiales bacterium]|nr:phosphatase PAP2 family protein [Chlamydiales bacterium]